MGVGLSVSPSVCRLVLWSIAFFVCSRSTTGINVFRLQRSTRCKVINGKDVHIRFWSQFIVLIELLPFDEISQVTPGEYTARRSNFLALS